MYRVKIYETDDDGNEKLAKIIEPEDMEYLHDGGDGPMNKKRNQKGSKKKINIKKPYLLANG